MDSKPSRFNLQYNCFESIIPCFRGEHHGIIWAVSESCGSVVTFLWHHCVRFSPTCTLWTINRHTHHIHSSAVTRSRLSECANWVNHVKHLKRPTQTPPTLGEHAEAMDSKEEKKRKALHWRSISELFSTGKIHIWVSRMETDFLVFCCFYTKWF